MENMKRLWEYQLVDLEYDKLDKSIKDTPTRKKLVKLQRFIKQSGRKLTERENSARVMRNKLSEIYSQSSAYLDDLEDLNKDISYLSECEEDELSREEVEEMIRNSEKLSNNINDLKRQILEIKQELEDSDKSTKELISKMVSVRTEYDGLYEEHKKELASGSGDLEALKSKVLDAASALPAEVIEMYRRIKSSKPNPVAILKNNRCEGCRMLLPSGITPKIASAKEPIQCENCGRILIILDEEQ